VIRVCFLDNNCRSILSLALLEPGLEHRTESLSV
jgi:hypothetical protein